MLKTPGDATFVLKRFFRDSFVIFRRSKRIAFLESVNFLRANFQFS